MSLNSFFDPLITKKRMSLDQQLARLEKERRDEDVSLWKDIQRPYQDLAEAQKKYQLLSSKSKSLVPKKFYQVLGLNSNKEAVAKKYENDPKYEEITNQAISRIP